MATDETRGPVGEAEFERDIEETRERLGQTLEQLGEKFDVKKQARSHVPQLAVAAAVAATLTALVIWRRRR
ncbi:MULTISPECIES: DUF3618 domain-containing protein [unclassified Nocardioides]|uniref:DUF3618 domain-containing protein n=1 Tax=unclassified Nocardioides TaxID=2615069 RepID=UPI0006F3A85A|nr:MULTISPECIES: DUF3618 domain-containing protein [unclassified Nocardioides]KQY51633.1 hypothetical protein ASD30_19905 [Nocardioides sp. Root140]KQZ70697.1 hypothetical protein ASD66_14060 [Nocardioides sp. Root151]KRF10965.1 hypothetical protein ASH02_19185 [Nocardioides sp. Soil796]